MPKPRALTPEEAKRTTMHRLAGTIDRARQSVVRVGLRPYRVFLVWTRATGDERGEGRDLVQRRFEVLPTPKVDSLDALALSPTAGGMVPLGSVRVSRITASLNEQILRGRIIPSEEELEACGCAVREWSPDREWSHLPEKWDFFYEVVEDGRGGPNPTRAKFRLASPPTRRAGKIDWVVTLERISEDTHPETGQSQLGDDDD